MATHPELLGNPLVVAGWYQRLNLQHSSPNWLGQLKRFNTWLSASEAKRPCLRSASSVEFSAYLLGITRRMEMKKVFFLIAVLLMGTVAIAQDGPKAEITGYYSYFRFN